MRDVWSKVEHSEAVRCGPSRGDLEMTCVKIAGRATVFGVLSSEGIRRILDARGRQSEGKA